VVEFTAYWAVWVRTFTLGAIFTNAVTRAGALLVFFPQPVAVDARCVHSCCYGHGDRFGTVTPRPSSRKAAQHSHHRYTLLFGMRLHVERLGVQAGQVLDPVTLSQLSISSGTVSACKAISVAAASASSTDEAFLTLS
jgi:hypothetical protein